MNFSSKSIDIYFFIMTFAAIIIPKIINAGNTPGDGLPKGIIWQNMTFKSSNVLGNTVVKFKIQSPAEISDNLLETMGLKLSGSPWKNTKCLTIETTVRKMLFFYEKYTEKIWFNSANGNVYRRIRYRKGNDPWIKIYHWTETGVRRQKIKPKCSSEKKEKPDKWTRRTRSFYAYPKDMGRCVLVSDPSFIFYRLSTLEPERHETSFKICAFGKKQLHSLIVRHETSLPIKVSFKVHSSSGEVSVNSKIKSCIFSIRAEPVTPENSKTELFSLFGLEKDIRIYMDFSRGLPVRISGTNTKIGKLVFELKDVKTR